MTLVCFVLGLLILLCFGLWWAANFATDPPRAKNSKSSIISTQPLSPRATQFYPQGLRYSQPISPPFGNQTPEEGIIQVNQKCQNLLGRLQRLEESMNRFEMTDTVIVPETLITPASPIKSPARKGVVATPKKGTPAAGDSKGKSPQSISNRPDPSTPSKLPNKKKVA